MVKEGQIRLEVDKKNCLVSSGCVGGLLLKTLTFGSRLRDSSKFMSCNYRWFDRYGTGWKFFSRKKNKMGLRNMTRLVLIM